MRLFAALPLPVEAVERLTRLRLRLSKPVDGLRWAPPEQWHITLLFFGSVDDLQAAALLRALAQGDFGGAPEIVLSGLGQFPAKGILYVSVEASPALEALHAAFRALSAANGVAVDSRPFHPHVTLARSRGRTGLRSLQQLAKPQLPAFGPELRWQADEIQMLRSTLQPQGAVYTVEAVARLDRRESAKP